MSERGILDSDLWLECDLDDKVYFWDSQASILYLVIGNDFEPVKTRSGITDVLFKSSRISEEEARELLSL